MISNMISKLLAQIKKHKFIAGILLLLVAAGGYWGYTKIFSNDGAVRYATAQVQKGTLIVSVSGSGQVSVSNQIDIKPKVSENIVYVGVEDGQEVKAGALIAQLDATDAQKAVRDAEIDLESAKLSLEKLKQSSADLTKITEDAFNNVSNAFLDLPVIINDAEVIILGSTINNPSGQSNAGFYKDFVSVSDTANRDRISLLVAAAQNDYTDARAKYDEAFLLYKNTSRYADSPAIINLLDKTAELSKSLAQALKSEKNVLDFITDYASANSKSVPSLINSYQATLRTDIGETNGFISTLIDAQNSLGNAPLDIKSQELAVKQKENALLDAQDKLADYFIRAPFDGVIAKVDVTKGDSVSPASIIATLITRQKLAEISLNEVDVATVKVGQKATLTFDAVPDLTIAGQVAEVDTVGTVSQGVVTYTVKISFDTQDNRVKPGMSVSAAIVTETKPNVLLVPNSAVKSQGGMSYVEIVEGDDRNTALAANATGVILKNTPRRQQVEIGTASDEFTEVTSGLKEGDVIVTRTIQPTAAKTTQTQQQSGGLRIPGLTGGGGGR
jgi:HlyD family secretion protein